MTKEGTFTCMKLVDQRKPIYSIYSMITNNIMTLTTAWIAIAATLLTRGKTDHFLSSVCFFLYQKKRVCYDAPNCC